MRRYAAILEYDGTQFHGWQRQPHASSVQAAVENALTRVANEEVQVVCAGRTDTGVHAAGQVVHFDSEAKRTLRQWLLGANANLPKSVAFKDIREVSMQFHARFSALSRTYRYLIYTAPTRSALMSERVTWEHQNIDAGRMQDGANFLLGEHDFTSFRALACQAKSPVRTVRQIRVKRHGSVVSIEIQANAFLHHMVRNIAGVLIEIGKGEQSIDWVKELLDARNRALAAMTAPPQGLYLLRVEYPQAFGLTPVA